MNNNPHEYISCDLGHSNMVCKHCNGTPMENSMIGEANHCEKAPKKTINQQRELLLKDNKIDDVITALEAVKCGECYGSGECNDADPGDMYYNTWKCEKCNGTGWNGEDLEIVK